MPDIRLKINQLDSRMKLLNPVQKLPIPEIGWIKSIRLALGISSEQLGKKLKMTRQGIHGLEGREQDGSITLKALREAAKALDMQLVYGFIPNDGSLNALIERKARELATQIVMRTSNTMKLEDQENSQQRIEAAIEERTIELKTTIPKILWD